MLCGAAVSNYDGAFVDTEIRRLSQADRPCEYVDIMI
jgi:hypothetical protein